MPFNELFIRLLILINNHRKNLTHSDYFRIMLISEDLNLPEYIIKTDNINIKLTVDKYIANFINYDFFILIEKGNINLLQIQPLSYFYTPKYFSLDSSLKIAHITCNDFYIPSNIIYEENNQLYIYPIEQSINILKKENS